VLAQTVYESAVRMAAVRIAATSAEGMSKALVAVGEANGWLER
jgi:hypothetical protein